MNSFWSKLKKLCPKSKKNTKPQIIEDEIEDNIIEHAVLDGAHKTHFFDRRKKLSVLVNKEFVDRICQLEIKYYGIEKPAYATATVLYVNYKTNNCYGISCAHIKSMKNKQTNRYHPVKEIHIVVYQRTITNTAKRVLFKQKPPRFKIHRMYYPDEFVSDYHREVIVAGYIHPIVQLIGLLVVPFKINTLCARYLGKTPKHDWCVFSFVDDGYYAKNIDSMQFHLPKFAPKQKHDDMFSGSHFDGFSIIGFSIEKRGQLLVDMAENEDIGLVFDDFDRDEHDKDKDKSLIYYKLDTESGQSGSGVVFSNVEDRRPFAVYTNKGERRRLNYQYVAIVGIHIGYCKQSHRNCNFGVAMNEDIIGQIQTFIYSFEGFSHPSFTKYLLPYYGNQSDVTEQWECTACAFLNHTALDECEMCNCNTRRKCKINGPQEIVNEININEIDIQFRYKEAKYKCICGEFLIKDEAKEFYNGCVIYCDICNVENKYQQIWHCNKEKIDVHKNGYDVCIRCFEKRFHYN